MSLLVSGECTKCGSGEVVLLYVHPRPDQYMPYGEPIRRQDEHIRHRCARCSYVWATDCLDALGAEDSKA